MITPSDVRWAYKYYLGRNPDDAEAVQYHQNTHGQDRTRLRAAFYNSDEAVSQPFVPLPPGQWCLWRPGKPRLVVVGDAMGTSLARAAAAMAELSVYGFDLLGAADHDDLAVFLEEADFILFPVLGEEFGRLNGGAMRERYGPKVVFYLPPRFEGVHPDSAWLGQGMRSALGDYHSKLVLKAVAEGVSAQDCLDGFEAGLAALNPREVFRAAEAAFHRREAGVDVRIGKWFFRTIRKKPLMYTTNNPTTDVLIEIAAAGLRKFGVRHADPNPVLVQNVLAGDTTWPVHPAVARAVGLGYATEPIFFHGNQAMSLGEYVWRCYEIYQRTGVEAVCDRARAFGII